MKKNDFKFIIAILVLACLFFVVTYGFRKEGDKVIVTIDGEERETYSLQEQADITLHAANGGTNRLIIQDGKAKIEYADCPDKLCVRQKAISKEGESIICLPHKLVLTISSTQKADVDSIAYNIHVGVQTIKTEIRGGHVS